MLATLSICLELLNTQTLRGVALKTLDQQTTTLESNFIKDQTTNVVVFGTYPGDFNMIEYAQKISYYNDKLRQKNVDQITLVANGTPQAAQLLAKLVDLPKNVQLLADENGQAANAFGVNRGWLPDTDSIQLRDDFNLPISPYAKLFGMLWGLGALYTLPSVISGYLGNPQGTNGWIEKALAQGQRAGRWPNTALELGPDGEVSRNKFDDLPLVGNWGRRPLELATLRLQNMIGLSISNWDELAPTDERCLTMLGGLLCVRDGETLFEWRDDGICHTADFEALLQLLD